MRLKKTIIFLFLTTGVLLGCASQTPVSSENTPSPTVQPDETMGDNGNDGSDASDSNDISSESGEAAIAQNSSNVDSSLILIADEVLTLEPYKMVSIHPDGSVANHLWDTLTRINDELVVEPSLAESWQLVSNFIWEFKLRESVIFHNGELLNAEAVRFSIERAQSMPGSLETFAQDVDLERVEVVDDYTIRLVTRQSVVNMPYHLAFLEILPPQYYAETGATQLAIAPVGSGPYQLGEAWSPGKPLVLEAVPDYWQGPPTLPRLIFKTVPLQAERLAALRQGEASLITDLSPISADQWNVPNSSLETVESTKRLFIGLRIEAGSPLADKRVRQALNYGLNVEQIVDDWLEGYGERYGSWVNLPSNNPDLAPWPYDPQLARELLAQAGYQQGFTVTLQAPIDMYHQDEAIAGAIAEQLEEIGVTVEVKTVDWTVHVQSLLDNDEIPPLFLLGINSHGDGLEDVKNLSLDFPFNPTGWQNEIFEDKLSQAMNTFNENSRVRLLNEAQSIAYDEAPWIWLWKQYDFYGVSQDLDWSPRRDGIVYLYKPATFSTENDE